MLPAAVCLFVSCRAPPGAPAYQQRFYCLASLAAVALASPCQLHASCLRKLLLCLGSLPQCWCPQPRVFPPICRRSWLRRREYRDCKRMLAKVGLNNSFLVVSMSGGAVKYCWPTTVCSAAYITWVMCMGAIGLQGREGSQKGGQEGGTRALMLTAVRSWQLAGTADIQGISPCPGYFSYAAKTLVGTGWQGPMLHPQPPTLQPPVAFGLQSQRARFTVCLPQACPGNGVRRTAAATQQTF